MAKKKKKRRTEFDIAGREKQKDYTSKRVNDGERFNESIVEKKSKLNNFDKEEPAVKSRLSSSKRIEKHVKNTENTVGSSINETVSVGNDATSYTRLERKDDAYDLNNDVPKGTESLEVKGRLAEHRNLDIGERKQGDKSYKRIHESEKFQDSVVEKKSKLKNDSRTTEESSVVQKNEDSNRETSRKLKRKKQKQIDKNKEKKRGDKEGEKEPEVYDPLSKDMDNDGIIDRYYNDFRDSDYEESTYDIDGLKKDVKPKNKDFYKKKAIKDYQKKGKNKDGKLTTDDVEVLKNGMAKSAGAASAGAAFKLEDLSDDAKKTYLKKEGKLIRKRKRASKLYDKPKYKLTAKTMGKVSVGSFIASEYMSAGSEENAAVKAVDKGLFAGGSIARHTQSKLQRKRRNPLKDEKRFALKHRKNMAKAEYQSNLENVKKTSEYQKKSAYKKLIKRKQMKKKIYEEHNIAVSFKDRIKKEAVDIIKGSSEVLRRNLKGILLGILFFIIGFVIISQLATMFLGGISTVTSNVMSTSYLSSENNLTNINQEFSSFEYALEDELSSIERNHPGYDEYEVHRNCDIGHETHVLLSYITAKYGEVKDVSTISADLANLFNEMYQVHYETVVETRYRWVCHGHGDDESCDWEPYDWYKLVVTVDKEEMDTLARRDFAGYEDNLAHYETLLESKGNMEAYFGSGSGDLSEIVDNPDFGNPGIAFTDKETKKLFAEAEKHIGKRYVFGGNGPANFDCSSFVCWSFTHSGIKNMPRTTAEMIYRSYCNPVSPRDAKAGDIIFFTGTYNSGTPISHVGIYAGNGMMLHAGDPIQYTSINSNYWKQHFYAFGRPK